MSLQSKPNVRIRIENTESADERAAVRTINEQAFGGQEEADLVDNLRGGAHVILSLVAEVEDQLVGHILFSRMWIAPPSGRATAVALAPMAVIPAHQRQGIGSLLVRRGLDILREREEKIVIVVGHPGFYPRFGFSSALAEPLESPFPPEAFMALELRKGALNGLAGPVVYPPDFGI